MNAFNRVSNSCLGFRIPVLYRISIQSSLEVYCHFNSVQSIINLSSLEVFYAEISHENIIGKRLKELRQQQNISQRILAARLTLSGVEFNDLTILRIEKGERFVPDYEIAVIADYFKVSADYLLGRKEQ